MRKLNATLFCIIIFFSAVAQNKFPAPTEEDYIIKDFQI